MMLAEAVEDQQRDPDSECAVRHIERGKRVEARGEPAAEREVIVHQQKIDDLAQRQPIPAARLADDHGGRAGHGVHDVPGAAPTGE